VGGVSSRCLRECPPCLFCLASREWSLPFLGLSPAVYWLQEYACWPFQRPSRKIVGTSSIASRTQQAGANPAQAYNFAYDPLSQLRSGILKDLSGAVLKSYAYDYDAAGNRTVEAIDSLVTGDTINNLNQLKTRQGGTGVVPIRGTTNEPSTVAVNGTPATVKADNSFEGKAAVTAGNNTVTVVATDVNGNTTTNRYNVAVTGSGSKTFTYDPNGNLTSDGTRTFEWDPLNRLTAVNSGTRSEFTYNGRSQRVKIVEKENGAMTSTKQFVWIPGDTQPSEERDGSNTVTKRYYPQGMQIGTTNYYYTKDHLGSIREMTDGNGVVHARYDYDPRGRLTKVQGDSDSDFTYAGYYNHSSSGLYATLNRFYDPDLGRWISRDPIGETGGINLYRYAANDPLKYTDPSGLEIFPNGVPSPDPGSVPTPLDIYDDLHDLRSQLRQEFGAGAANDDMRHCVAACIAAKRYGTGISRLAGVVNELEGLILDIRFRQTGAFQPSDLRRNEQGIDASRQAASESECRENCKKKRCPPEEPMFF